VKWSLKRDDAGTGGKVRDDHARAQRRRSSVRFSADDQHN
jgi:hypothetical protein